ncbi:AAA family ATPase [Halomarina salina]|uniref:AAA family ATPase n=1 Tax=Halomarina salina TaxID=1872699 RepID=A0ABD5RV07_9EURY
MTVEHSEATLDIASTRWYCTQFFVDYYKATSEWDAEKRRHERTGTVVEELLKTFVETEVFSGAELTALKSVCQTSSVIGQEKTIERVRATGGAPDRLDAVVELIQSEEELGIIGGTALKVAAPTDDVEVQLIDSFATLIDETAENQALDTAVKTILDLPVQDVGLATLTPVFCLLYPERYPIVNHQTKVSIKACLDLDVPKDPDEYFEAIELFSAIRADFDFEDNFRHLDFYCYWANERTDVNEWFRSNDIADRAVWQLNAGLETDGGPDTLWPLWREHGLCSIGWDIGDLSKLSRDEIDARAASESSADAGVCLKRFRDALTPGTIVLAKDGEQLLGIGVIQSEAYRYHPNAFDEHVPAESVSHPHLRPVEWVAITSGDEGPVSSWAPEQGLSAQKTLAQTNHFESIRYALANRTPSLREDLFDIEREVAAVSAARHPSTDTEDPPSSEHETSPDDELDRTPVEEPPISEAAPYYWVSQGNKEELEEEYLQAPDDSQPHHDLRKLAPGDIVFNYREGAVVGYSEVTSEPYYYQVDTEEQLRVDIDLQRFSEPLQFADVFAYLIRDDVRLDTYYPVNKAGMNQQYLFNLSEKAGEYLLTQGNRQRAPERLTKRLSLPRVDPELPNQLYYPPTQARQLRSQLSAAINSGKHVILTGPPGTGKSKIAEAICSQATTLDSVDDWVFTTATAEWTAYDTVGGYMPRRDSDELAFSPGQFLRCFRDRDGTLVNKWLVIDELNRSDIDKAFGQVFSVLAGDSVELPYEGDGHPSTPVRIEAVNEKTDPQRRDRIATDPDRYPITGAWRLIGTMNTADKASLYEMSYAFMRRFAFVHVGIPEIATEDGLARQWLLDPTYDSPGTQPANYASAWLDGETGDERTALHETLSAIGPRLAVLWSNIEGGRPIGPAIIHDIVSYVHASDGSATNGDNLTDALIALVFPQFEGMRPEQQRTLIQSLDTPRRCVTQPGRGDSESSTTQDPVAPELATDRLYRTAEDMFGITLTDESDDS